MGSAYLFSLVVGFGILMIQTVLGSKDAHGEGELGADKEFHFEGDGHADHELDLDGDVDHQFEFDGELDGDADADAGADGGESELEALQDGVQLEHAPGADKDVSFATGFVALFLSTRFWIFASLGFGLTGTLLHRFTEVAASATLAAAITMALILGLSAALAFRTLKRTASATVADTAGTVGRVARVIVPCGAGALGKVRIELRGQSVDLLAKAGPLRIGPGDKVVIEELDGEVAMVSRAPEELQ